MIPFDGNKLVGQSVAVIDFETDSPDPTMCWPVQVAIARFVWGVSKPRIVYTSLIRPPDPIPEGATAIHGITNEAVADAPSIPEAFYEISKHLEGHVLAAYNLPYEWQILNRLLPDCPPFAGFDPLVWAKLVDKYEKGKKLSDVAGRRSIPLDAHDARSDALATALLLPILAKELISGVTRKGRKNGPWCEPRDSETVGCVVAWQMWQALELEADFAAYCKKEGRPPPRLDWHQLGKAMEFFKESEGTSENETKAASQDGPEVALGERGESVLWVPDESEGPGGPFFDQEGNQIP